MLTWPPPHQLRQVLKVIMNVFLAIHVGMSQSRPQKTKPKKTNKQKNRTTCELLLWANDITVQFKKLLKTVINEYFNGLLKLHFQISKRRSYVSVCYPYVTRMPPYVTFMYVSLCNPCVTRVYPETIVRSCIRLKQTDRTSWTIQTHSDELNWARRRTFHGSTLFVSWKVRRLAWA